MAPRPEPLEGLPLTIGSSGEAVADLHRRLADVGFAAECADQSRYDGGTAAALAAFQRHRGLVPDGVCDHQAWSALIEAGFRAGDRLLYLRQPMLRGDDVAELQRRLGHLGFDAGRIDGIFGPDTEHALRDFQRNTAIAVDGVCGPEVLAALARLGSRLGDTVAVGHVRQREVLRGSPRGLTDRRVLLAEDGGLEVVVDATARALRDRGAIVVVVHHPDGSAQAAAANEFDAEVVLGLTSTPGEGCGIAYYATEGWESVGGHRLAELLGEELGAGAGPDPGGPVGLRLPLLRETRMPAVLCRLLPVGEVVRHRAEVAASLATAISRWTADPIDR